jgi:5-methylthioadenosine/S-adenosylhomocysteine deaminase
MHVHETEQEIKTSIEHFRVRPLERLTQLGLLTDRLLAVHMTQLLPSELEAIADNGTHVIHCPESNLKLASGFCPVAALFDAGVNVALGTDGAASNNDLDMLSEMRTAALLAKGVGRDPTILPAHQALRMATVNGARALGLEDTTGTITPGKCADLVAVDLNHVNTQPTYDPVTQLIYSANRDQISDVWVNGKQVVRDGTLETIDLNTVLAQVTVWADRIIATDSQGNAKAAS